MLKLLKNEVDENNCTILTSSITQRNLMREILQSKKQASPVFDKINTESCVLSLSEQEAIGVKSN